MNMDFTPVTGFFRHRIASLKSKHQHADDFAPFIGDLLRQARPLEKVERLRSSLKNSSEKVITKDFGAGSKVQVGNEREISRIASQGISSKREAAFFSELVKCLNAVNVVELGTSLGIGSMYLAHHAQRLWSFEGCPEIAGIATRNFEDLGYSDKINLRLGQISKTLPEFMNEVGEVDLAYLDANHTYDATLWGFNVFFPKMSVKSVIVVDDIHWSKGMQRAWDEIKADVRVRSTIDFYDFGLVLLGDSFPQGHASFCL